MTTVERFISYLRDELRHSRHTVEAYRRDIDAWIEHYGREREIAKATPADIRSFIAFRSRQGYATSSLRRTVSAIRALFAFMMKTDGLQANPAEGINPGRLPRRLPVNIRPAETETMLDELRERAEVSDTFADIRTQLIMEMLYATGLRSSELMELRDDRVDTCRCELRVTGKRNKERVIPFGPDLKDLIELYRQARTAPDGPGAAAFGEPFFVRDDGRPLYRKMVYNVAHGTMLEAGVHVSRMSPHVMRHSFATDMLSGGAKLNTVQQLLGHASLATTQIYTHISLEELRKNYAAAHPRAHS